MRKIAKYVLYTERKKERKVSLTYSKLKCFSPKYKAPEYKPIVHIYDLEREMNADD